eukprot:TRINITY_DN25854_c0_g2_i2.p1 TRINITY_DN25854_c0_g2~~TRINITY_DN25854_c0_g2_i2.p1  ORF type:complete len:613 (-),score=111.17 TRINITY_DN25854_c0_g2_i2:153-1991(-)
MIATPEFTAGDGYEAKTVLEVLAVVQQQLADVIHGQGALQALVRDGFGHGVEPSDAVPETKLPSLMWDASATRFNDFNLPDKMDDSYLHHLGKAMQPLEQPPLEPMSPMTPMSPLSPNTGKRRKKLLGGAARRICIQVPETSISPTNTETGKSPMSLPGEDPPSPLQRRGRRLQSRSAFDSVRTADEDKEELRTVFLRAEKLEAEKEKHLSAIDRIRGADREIAVDSCIGFIICLNAIFIGFSMDSTPEQEFGIFVTDFMFSTVFILELLIKLSWNGCCRHFRGQNAYLNIFDTVLITIDLFQLLLHMLSPDSSSTIADLPSASLFRVVRLARLVRILRLLRHPVLNTLLLMVRGMAGGLPTLGWALVMFILSVYIIALMGREFLGRRYADNISEHFDSVPKSMVTTFRCSFGECDSFAAGPIFDHVTEEYGIGATALYCLFLFTMSMGMFNVISSIFVQSTLSAAVALQRKQKKARLQDDDLWSTRLAIIVERIASLILHLDPSEKLSDNIDIIYDLDVSCQTMDEIGADPVVRAALDDLDVDAEDHEILSEILDVDQNGSVVVIELLQCIKQLRGNPRRSDIVTVHLMCRSLMLMLKEVHQMLREGLAAK